MNEITRIHIAKTAYDIEIAAKKQLEKYIKSLESYTQDAEVLQDIEIRITELLADRGVKPGGVIGVDDVMAIRTQLGEPHEFADDEGDIAIGQTMESTGRRLYRATDTAVLGGVLGGVASYFNVNPLWTRLIFVVLVFVSFGFASLVYVLFWVIIPPARSATEKLQLAGKEVTVGSIRALNEAEDKQPKQQAQPILVKILSIGLGVSSAIMALLSFALAIWLTISALTMTTQITELTNGFNGLGLDASWIVWMLFWIVVFGVLLFTALMTLVSYALLAQRLTKTMLISGVILIILGIASVATVVGVSATQSVRVATESRSLVRDTKVTLPKELAAMKSMRFEIKQQDLEDNATWRYGAEFVDIRYIVDDGPVRYELSALPSTSVTVSIDDVNAVASIDVGSSFRNSFVRPELIIYGPALDLVVSKTASVQYDGQTQEQLRLSPLENTRITAVGSFGEVTVTGEGSADLSSSTVGSLIVNSGQNMMVTAGTVRELRVTQPDVCPSGTYANNTQVVVSGITADTMTYNDIVMPAKTHQTSCAAVIIEPTEAVELYE